MQCNGVGRWSESDVIVKQRNDTHSVCIFVNELQLHVAPHLGIYFEPVVAQQANTRYNNVLVDRTGWAREDSEEVRAVTNLISGTFFTAGMRDPSVGYTVRLNHDHYINTTQAPQSLPTRMA
jgi:hypothetical protein